MFWRMRTTCSRLLCLVAVLIIEAGSGTSLESTNFSRLDNSRNFSRLPTSVIETESWITRAKSNDTVGNDTVTPRGLAETIAICLFSGVASFITVGGNILVIMSFVLNKKLRTLNNYFILSLASADLLVGTISMNLFTINIVKKQWPLGTIVCNFWLTLDYVASNASVMNLLLICLDRYFSVTHPVKYRNNRTQSRILGAIAGAWIASFLLWAPWINLWPYLVGKWTVPENQCYISFINDSKTITIITAFSAFYLPAGAMCVLYWKVIQGINNRRSLLTTPHSVSNGNSRGRSARKINVLGLRLSPGGVFSARDWLLKKIRLPRRDQYGKTHQSESNENEEDTGNNEKNMEACLRTDHTHVENHIVSEPLENPADGVHHKDTSSEIAHDSAKSDDRCDVSTGVQLSSEIEARVARKLPGNPTNTRYKNYPFPVKRGRKLPIAPKESEHKVDDRQSEDQETCEIDQDVSKTNTINGESNNDQQGEDICTQPIVPEEEHQPLVSQVDKNVMPTQNHGCPSNASDNATIGTPVDSQRRRTHAAQNLSKETKAARLLAAILAAFILLWLPYNVLVLVQAFCRRGNTCVSEILWSVGYWLCYLNSTLNPVCYAMCNNAFRQTFKIILSKKWWKQDERRRMNRQIQH